VSSIAAVIATFSALSACASFNDSGAAAARSGDAGEPAKSVAIGKRVHVVDMRGRPPYRREIVEINANNVAEFARFEETGRRFDGATPTTSPEIGQRLHVVHARGRPPFRREIVEIDANNIAEFARFEEAERPRVERRRFGPPGKGFPRR
jgi:hypothetical protein